MTQCINVFRNNSFVNPKRLLLLCRNSRAVAQAEPGLTAGWLTGWILSGLKIISFRIMEGCVHQGINHLRVFLHDNTCKIMWEIYEGMYILA